MELKIQAEELTDIVSMLNEFLKGVRKVEKDVVILANPDEDWEKPEKFLKSAKKIIFSTINTDKENFENDLTAELNKYDTNEFNRIYCRICGKDYTILMTDKIKRMLMEKYPQMKTLISLKYMGRGFKIFLMLVKK